MTNTEAATTAAIRAAQTEGMSLDIDWGKYAALVEDVAFHGEMTLEAAYVLVEQGPVQL